MEAFIPTSNEKNTMVTDTKNMPDSERERRALHAKPSRTTILCTSPSHSVPLQDCTHLKSFPVRVIHLS
eukprot:2227193-Amphidinium_carterae.1